MGWLGVAGVEGGLLVTTRRSLTIQTVEKWPQPSFLMTTYLFGCSGWGLGW